MDDCVACVDTFVEVVRTIMLLVRHEAERSQCEAIEGKWGDSSVDDGAAKCYACEKIMSLSKDLK